MYIKTCVIVQKCLKLTFKSIRRVNKMCTSRWCQVSTKSWVIRASLMSSLKPSVAITSHKWLASKVLEWSSAGWSFKLRDKPYAVT